MPLQFLLKENPQVLECNKCNGVCCTDTVYRKFSENLSTCMEALLCDQVPVPPLDLVALDDNFKEIDGKVDILMCYREECCFGNHVSLARSADGATTTRHMCGWNSVLVHCHYMKGLRYVIASISQIIFFYLVLAGR